MIACGEPIERVEDRSHGDASRLGCGDADGQERNIGAIDDIGMPLAGDTKGQTLCTPLCDSASGRGKLFQLLTDAARTAAGQPGDAKAGFLAEDLSKFLRSIRQATTKDGGTLVTRNGERIGGDDEAGAHQIDRSHRCGGADASQACGGGVDVHDPDERPGFQYVADSLVFEAEFVKDIGLSLLPQFDENEGVAAGRDLRDNRWRNRGGGARKEQESEPENWHSEGECSRVSIRSVLFPSGPYYDAGMKLLAVLLVGSSIALWGQTRGEILAAMKRAAGFYVEKVSTGGGYHFAYADDLSFGRSEHGEGPTQVETQREGTPAAGMAFLEAWWVTGDRYYLEAAAKAARAGVAGQLCSGGWDYVIEFDPAKRAKFPYRADENCGVLKGPPTTLDDNVTQAMVRLLMRVDEELKFKDAAIHDAVVFALDKLMAAQYPNGAWPQRFTAPPVAAKFPVRQASYPENWSRTWTKKSYEGHYTFNDNSIADMIDMFLEAAQIYSDSRYRAAAERGGGFILLAQMPAPQPGWAQQYDAEMHPAWARQFEPPSVTGGETQGLIRVLLLLHGETGEGKYLDAAGRALAWLERSVIPGKGKLARFYELKTNRPLYITKGTQVTAKGLGSARIDGYELSYDDGSVITYYAVVVGAEKLPALRAAYEASRLTRVKRVGRLHGLSPWSDSQRPRGGKVDGLIAGLDARGAWVEEGVIGKADKVVSVFAARDMVLTINGHAVPVKENDKIELFNGAQPPRGKVIRTTTFARNLEQLAGALGRSR